MTLLKPLNDDEVDELEAFLIGLDEDCQIGDVSMFDGFVTALVIGPELVSISEWLPAAIANKGKLPFESTEEADRMLNLMQRHWNGIANDFADSSSQFEPLFYERDIKGIERTVPDHWCVGFMYGIELRRTSWQPLFDSEEGDVLAPIMMFATEQGVKEMAAADDQDASHAFWLDQVYKVLPRMHRFWLQHHDQKEVTIPAGAPGSIGGQVTAKSARNEACPCGSGKKFKKCCGDPAIVRH